PSPLVVLIPVLLEVIETRCRPQRVPAEFALLSKGRRFATRSVVDCECERGPRGTVGARIAFSE
ncbi:MAG TPA: hypothetical protein VFR67_25600, partial [Pilimelia sp.]|nr:hypothetical protein [Pilimelia sp.]